MDSLTGSTKIPILVGPTGVGKSEVAYRLALKLGFEIISADAFQVYQGMAVGTAQPSVEFQKKVKHHLVDVRKPEESWNAVQFATHAKKIIDADKSKRFLIVGGAGFYIRALVDGPPAGGAPSPKCGPWWLKKFQNWGPKKRMNG